MANATHTCAICLEDLVIPSPNMCMTECSHIFHLNCLIRSREHNTTCPLCRADIPNEQPDNEVIEVNIMEEADIPNEQPDNEVIEVNIMEEADLIENIENVLLEIVNGTQLTTSITDIVSNASNNNISNMDIEERHRYIDQIHNLCIEFSNSMFNYLTNFRHVYNIDYIDYNNVNLYYYTSVYNINQKITEIVERAAINDIRLNITFYRMENDIHDLCLGFSEYLIVSLH
jgi:hypothetical protein